MRYELEVHSISALEDVAPKISVQVSSPGSATSQCNAGVVRSVFDSGAVNLGHYMTLAYSRRGNRYTAPERCIRDCGRALMVGELLL
jgi:hypothetical protein